LAADDRPEALAPDVRARAVEAFALLEQGLGAFAAAAAAAVTHDPSDSSRV
jgi:hypothetical protein